MVEILPFQNALGGVSLGTLAQGIVMDIETAHGTGLLVSFLMKKVIAEIVLDTPDSGDIIRVGMARGDATITEIKTALELTQLERDQQDQANVRVVLFETMRLLAETSGGTRPLRIEQSLGGGLGIPFEDGDGWKWFGYNAGANDFVSGAMLFICGHYYGVWL